MNRKIDVGSSTIHRWESMETLETDTIRTWTTADLKLLKRPAKGKKKKDHGSEYVEARQSIKTRREGDTETLSAFLPPF